MTLKGKHLYGAEGEDIGEVQDMVGMDGEAPQWVTVKTGLLSKRLVPFTLIRETEDRLESDLTSDDVKSAPKVPAHVEPAGEDLGNLRRHYRLDGGT